MACKDGINSAHTSESPHSSNKQGSYRQVQVKVQGLLKASPTVFKDLMKNSDRSVKILLQKC